MRPHIFLMPLMSCIIAGGCTSSDAKSKAISALKECRGKELHTLEKDRGRELLDHMAALGIKRDLDELNRFGPWHVWDFSKSGEPPLYLLVEAGKKMTLEDREKTRRVHPHPGTTSITLTLLDDSGKVTAKTDLATGWRCYLEEFKLHPVGKNDDPVLKLATELGSGPGPDIRSQYYARIGERFDLVRIENAAGKATRNQYYIKHFRSGPKVAQLTEGEWEADLLSNDRLKVLRTLVWIGGFHWDLQASYGDQRQCEDAEQVQLWQKVLKRQKVIDRIRDLTKSEDHWLREAAELAADPQSGHF